MEHPNLSLRLNNADNSFNQLSAFDSFKKNLNGTNDYSADSGYLTNSSINHTGASSSRLCNLSSASFKRSVDLAPINELQEFNCSEASQSCASNETPTTKSIRQLNAFHINTPPLNRSETTPTKGNYFAQAIRSDRSHSSRKKSRQRLYSPYKANSQLSISRERRTLFDKNDENEFASHDVSIGFSPIGTFDEASAKITPVKIHQMQRHLSGIESSTPKTSTLRRIQTQATVMQIDNSTVENRANRLIRKTQSFNPNKMVLRESNASNIIAQRGNASNESNHLFSAHNPAITMLTLSNELFDQLLDHRSSADMQTPTKQQKAVDLTTARQLPQLASPPVKKSPFKAKHRSRIMTEFSQKRSLRSLAATKSSTILADSLNESDIMMALTDASNQEPSPILPPLVDNAFIGGSKTPKVPNFMIAAKSGTPHRDNSMTHSMQVEANRTPTKRFNRSTSINPTHLHYNPEKEDKKAIERLACTPPKKPTRRTVKRPANKSIDLSPAAAPPSAKRKLYRTVEQRTRFFDKCFNVDILQQLTNFNLTNITTSIFNELTERDLQTVRSTCKAWSEAIINDPIHNKRRRKYLNACQTAKENVHRSSKHSQSMNITNNNSDFSLLLENRKPFNMSNVSNSIVERPEPVSPSTRKFRENQEVRVVNANE